MFSDYIDLKKKKKNLEMVQKRRMEHILKIERDERRLIAICGIFYLRHHGNREGIC